MASNSKGSITLATQPHRGLKSRILNKSKHTDLQRVIKKIGPDRLKQESRGKGGEGGYCSAQRPMVRGLVLFRYGVAGGKRGHRQREGEVEGRTPKK